MRRLKVRRWKGKEWTDKNLGKQGLTETTGSKLEEGTSKKLTFAKRFEELEVWQEARRLAAEVYIAFRECKDFGFRNQIQDASVSVMNNIAEGFERKSKVEFCRFLDIAKGSSGETRSMLYLAQDVGHITSKQATELIQEYEILSKRIASLMNMLQNKSSGR